MHFSGVRYNVMSLWCYMLKKSRNNITCKVNLYEKSSKIFKKKQNKTKQNKKKTKNKKQKKPLTLAAFISAYLDSVLFTFEVSFCNFRTVTWKLQKDRLKELERKYQYNLCISETLIITWLKCQIIHEPIIYRFYICL